MSSDAYPDFLSTEFFTAALANGLNVQPSTVHVLTVSLSAGSKSGENFCSDVYRAVVQYRLQDAAVDTVSLIVKAMPHTQARGPILDDLLVFDKEVSMYTDTLPRMSQLLGGLKLSAKYYYSVSTPFQIVVLEDLKASGYTMADRVTGIDENHCNLVLETLGKLHAASIVLAEQDARAMDPYSFGMVNAASKNHVVMKSLLEGGLQSVIQMASTWPGYEKIVDQMKAIQNNFLDKIYRHCIQPPLHYKVLNHGDCWVNNFMFKYDPQGTPVQLVLIDYQMSYYSSPGYDLNYFLNTSPTNELREHRRDHLISTYHSAFVRALTDLRSPLATEMTMDRTSEEIGSREFFGFFAALGVLPLILKVEKRSGSSLDEIIGVKTAEGFHATLFGNPAYARAMQFILRRFYELHVFESAAEL